MSHRFTVCLFVISCIGSTTTVPKAFSQSVGLDRVLTGVSAKSLPVNFVNNLIFVTPVTVHGDTLRLYTDTGGGTEMIYPETVDKIKFEVFYDVQDGDSTKIVAFPPFKSEASIPLPNLFSSYGQFLYVPDEHLGGNGRDGFLGRTWFAGRVWDFDYINKNLRLVDGYTVEEITSRHIVKLGFQTDSTGMRTTHFPRIRVEVDGDTLDMLFDTGAMTTLPCEIDCQTRAENELVGATSFISESIFSKWTTAHPEWQVIHSEDFPLGMPMIEVPTVELGGYQVGPVCFSKRPDQNFSEYMSRWMDYPIQGALGGSAFRYFRIILDYPNALAIFER